jgi:lipopolysaccharide biosynthesis glycosyltransferase
MTGIYSVVGRCCIRCLKITKKKIFVIHILISDLCDGRKGKLRDIIRSYGSKCIFHRVEESMLQGVQFRKKFPKYAAYFKLLLSSIIDKECAVVLYLDSDIIVNGEITHIFGMDISEYALAAVEDIPIEYDHRIQLSLPYTVRYFNSGVMLLNLDYWRKIGAEEKLLRFAKRERLVFFHDQDALNAVFCNQWLSLHPRWNRFKTYPYRCFPCFTNWKDEFLFKKHPLIIHYAGYLKPWYNIPFIPYRGLYRKYLRLTPWRDCGKSYKLFREIFLRLTVYILQRMRLHFVVRRIAISKYKKDMQTRCSHKLS